MSSRLEDRTSQEAVVKGKAVLLSEEPDEATTGAGPKSVPTQSSDSETSSDSSGAPTSSPVVRVRHLFGRPVTALVLSGLLLVASVVLIAIGGSEQSTAEPSPQEQGIDWYGLARDLAVPMTVAAFSWFLHLVALARQAELEARESSRREAYTLMLQEKSEEHERSLQRRQEELAMELQEREAELEHELTEKYNIFRSRLEAVRKDWQFKLANQRDRMTARLSIAGHVGDVNGHLSAIEAILSAMSPEEPSETAASEGEVSVIETADDSAFEIAEGVIRIPERLVPLIGMPSSQGRE